MSLYDLAMCYVMSNSIYFMLFNFSCFYFTFITCKVVMWYVVLCYGMLYYVLLMQIGYVKFFYSGCYFYQDIFI